jgi:hypothetical protein
MKKFIFIIGAIALISYLSVWVEGYGHWCDYKDALSLCDGSDAACDSVAYEYGYPQWGIE